MDSMNRILVGGNELKSLGLKGGPKDIQAGIYAGIYRPRLKSSSWQEPAAEMAGRRLIYFVNFSSRTPGQFQGWKRMS